MSPRTFLEAGHRIFNLERFMNTREGITRADDTLPQRFINEGRMDDPENHTAPLEPMLNSYYRLRGWDENGIPTSETLKTLMSTGPGT